MAGLSHFFPQKAFVPVALAFFPFCHWDVKLCKKKKHHSQVFRSFPVAFDFLLLVKFGAKVKVSNSKFKNEVIFEVFHQQKFKKKSKNRKFLFT